MSAEMGKQRFSDTDISHIKITTRLRSILRNPRRLPIFTKDYPEVLPLARGFGRPGMLEAHV